MKKVKTNIKTTKTNNNEMITEKNLKELIKLIKNYMILHLYQNMI